MISRAAARYHGYSGYLVLLWLESLSAVGSGLTAFVVGVWAWQTYHSARALTQVLTLLFIPNLLVVPLAGAFVDRWRRKAILIVTNLFGAATIAWLAWMFHGGRLALPHIVVLGAVNAALAAFRRPSIDASLVLMVPPDKRTRANAIAQTLGSTIDIVSMVLCGILLGLMRRDVLLAFDIATFVVAAVGVAFVAVPDVAVPGAARRRATPRQLVAEIVEAARFVAVHPSLLSLALASALFNLIGGAFISALLLPMASTVWRHAAGAASVGALMVRIGGDAGGLDASLCAFVTALSLVGSFVGGVFISTRARPVMDRIADVFGAAVIVGLSEIVLSGRSLGAAAAAALAMGLAAPLIHTSLQTIWMQKTPAHMQGRVFSLFVLIAQVTYPVGLTIVGFLSSHADPSRLLRWSGLAFVANALLWWVQPSVRRLDELVPDVAHTEPARAGTQA